MLINSLFCNAQAGMQLPDNKLPLTISTALFIEDVAKVNPMEQTIELNGTLFLKWFDSRLQFECSKPMGECEKYFTGPFLGQTLTQIGIWYPQIEIINSRNKRNIEMQALIINSNGKARYLETFNVELFSRMDFSRFPFDIHQFEIVLAPYALSSQKVQLKRWMAKEGIAKRTQLAEWNIDNITHQQFVNKNRHGIGNKSLYKTTLTLKRYYGYYIWKNILPIIIIVMVSWSVLWMSGENIGAKLSVCVSTVIAIIAYQWVIMHNIPKVPYSVLMSVLITISFIYICLVLAVTVIMRLLEIKFTYKQYKKVEFCMRFAVPFAYIMLLVIILFLYL